MERGGKMKEFTEDEIYEQAKWIVENEVIMCASWLMDALVRDAEEHPRESPIDIEEYWSKCCGETCPECGSRNFITLSEYENQYFPDPDDEDEYDFNYYCEDCGEQFDYPREIEVLEYWFVDDFLANNLKEKGEVIINSPRHHIWGRQTSGQSISQDWVIQEIAKDILERQNR